MSRTKTAWFFSCAFRYAKRVMSRHHVAECYCHRLGAPVKMLSATKNELGNARVKKKKEKQASRMMWLQH